MSYSEALAYLNLNLAEVSAEILPPEETFKVYQNALQPMKNAIIEASKVGELDWTKMELVLLQNFTNFCHSANLKDMDLESLWQPLVAYKEKFSIEGEEAVKIGLLLLHLKGVSFDSEAIKNAFAEIVSQIEAKEGRLSQQAQDVYVDFAKLLNLRGEDELMSSIIRERLEELTPGYQKQLIAQKTSSASTLTDRVVRRLTTNPDTLAQLSQIHVDANAAYTAGDYEKSFKLHMQAAVDNYDPSEFSIGTFYQLGIGCEEDMTQARKYYLLASEQGHAVAQLHLAVLLQMGLGGKADIFEAIHWYEEAAKLGNTQALMNMAAVYCTPLLGATNYAVAIDYYLQAYEMGVPTALKTTLDYFGFPVEMFS